MTTNITNDDDDDDDDKVGKWTVYHEAALSTDDVWRLRDVSTVHKIVVRVIEFAVAEFQLDEKVLQYLIVDLSQRQHARKQPVVMVTSTKLIGAHRHVIAMATRISSRHRHSPRPRGDYCSDQAVVVFESNNQHSPTTIRHITWAYLVYRTKRITKKRIKQKTTEH